MEMAGFASRKAKRKDLEEFYDEEMGHPLSRPATKIRRLDADMLSVMEENDTITVSRLPYLLPKEQLQDMEVVPTHNVATYHPNEERSLVIYNTPEALPVVPADEPMVSFRMSSNLIHGIKNKLFKLRDQTVFNMDDKVAASNDSLALVPWVPQQESLNSYEFIATQFSDPQHDPMDSEQAEAVLMEVEENKEQPGTHEFEANDL
ncbi:uncharacterized protein LOC121996536 [Zingiber officinale]|uniref:Uncharacterized protein n=1 Tax=Zingiber officinale TaxID=94328 RepID=A0A8J5G2L3_ZINOF|nr:uncharacterized protein LOC121996536 [Zingiber officinale]KAG6499833.1 hypothetical protein ZIOFF_039628 [Zingiber officinale]